MTEDNHQKVEIDWLKTLGGALAAVSSAILLSTLGAAGTIIGAALGSVIVTVGGALYTSGLARSRERVAAQTAALRKVGVAQAEVRRASRRGDDEEAAEAHLAHADERLDEAMEELDPVTAEPDEPGWRERLAALPWKRISLLAAGLFVGVIVAITVFELVVGESVSEITGGTEDGGGTTISQVGRDKSPHRDKEPSDGASPTGSPSGDGSPTDEPTASPSEEPSESPSDSTPTPDVSPSVPETPLPSEESSSPPG